MLRGSERRIGRKGEKKKALLGARVAEKQERVAEAVQYTRALTDVVMYSERIRDKNGIGYVCDA